MDSPLLARIEKAVREVLVGYHVRDQRAAREIARASIGPMIERLREERDMAWIDEYDGNARIGNIEAGVAEAMNNVLRDLGAFEKGGALYDGD